MDLLSYWWLLPLVLIAVFIVRRWAFNRRYQAKPFLMTPAEIRAYRYLEKQVAPCRLFSQVRVADVISVSGKQNRSWWRAFSQISSKHVDYVLVRADFSIVACIELDDSSHERKDRKQRDKLLDHVFKDAGLPLVRMKPGRESESIPILKDLMGQRS